MYVPCLVISLQPDKACPALESPALPALFPRPWKDTEPALYVPNTFGPSARRKQGNDSTETRGEGQLLIQAQATAHPSTLMQFPSQLLLQGCPRSEDTHTPPPEGSLGSLQAHRAGRTFPCVSARLNSICELLPGAARPSGSRNPRPL